MMNAAGSASYAKRRRSLRKRRRSSSIFFFLKPVPAETGMPAWEQPSLPPCGAMHYRDIRKSYFMLTFQISESGPLYGVMFWKNEVSSSTLLSYAYIFLRW